MNDNSPKTRKLSDDQMDLLLNTFYRTEIPAGLDTLPSSWPQFKPAAAVQTTQNRLSPAAASRQPVRTSAGRGMAVVAATLAACVMLIVTSSHKPEDHSAVAVETQDPVTVEDPDLMLVSPNAGVDDGGVIGSDGTTAFEIDGVKFGPEKKPAKPRQSDEDKK